MALAPGAARRLAREPRAPAAARGVAARATGRRSSSTSTARSCPSSPRCAPRGRAAHEREPARERRRAAARPRRCPTSATTPSRSTSPATTLSEATRVLGGFLRDVIARQPDDVPPLRPRRDRVEPARRRVRGRPTARGRPRSSRPTSTSRRDGRVMEVLSEHLCQGWLEGYLLTGRHGLFNCYEAFIHIVDSMFNQHAKWLKVTRDDPVAAADRVAQLPAQLARLAAGPQRLLAPGSRLHRPRREQEGGDHPRLPAAGRELLLSVADHCLRSRDYVNVIVAGKQPALELPVDGRRDRPLHARHRDLGVGLERRRRRAGRRARAAAATSRRSRRSPPRRSCASTCPS